MNGVMMQYFHWYSPADGSVWRDLAADAANLASKGVTAIWFPPCYKGAGGGLDVGYGTYDLFDLGEFDQQNSVRTKYGTKTELLAAIRAVHDSGMQAYADVVHNHKQGGDELERFNAQEVRWDNRNQTIGDWHQISSYTRFNFPGRAGQHSTFRWHWWCFDALSYNHDTGNIDHLYRLKAKNYATEVSSEKGNYDFLTSCDLDMGEDYVRRELMYWGEWFLRETGFDGFRLDAVKHIRYSWFRDWLGHLRWKTGRELFSVGEFWSDNVTALLDYLDRSEGTASLFDVPLHYNFHRASESWNRFDMRRILDGTLVRARPAKAVTFVENHDSQPCQMLESPVQDWFKPLAYALILLRREGYPCVFLGDYRGASYHDKNRDIRLASHETVIDRLLWARGAYGYGEQHDYFDHPNTIGWTRLGTSDHPGAMAVVLTNGTAGRKWMNVYRPNKTFRDATRQAPEKVTTNADGWGEFRCLDGSVSAWVQE
jgi:alpha-amylase